MAVVLSPVPLPEAKVPSVFSGLSGQVALEGREGSFSMVAPLAWLRALSRGTGRKEPCMVSRLPFEAGGSRAPASWGSCGGSPGVSGKENQALEPTRHGFLWLPLAGGGGTWMDLWNSVPDHGRGLRNLAGGPPAASSVTASWTAGSGQPRSAAPQGLSAGRPHTHTHTPPPST